MSLSWGLHVIAALLLTSYVFAKRRPWENEGMFEGDIAGIDPYILYDRNAVIDEAALWPGGIIYYEIDSPLMKAEDAINEAIAEFEAKTCLRFRKRTTSTKDYCKLIIAKGCWSWIGRQGGMQNVSLGEGCHTKVTAIHELMHATGFWHEHARSDRDDYLQIIWKNIEKGQEHNFVKRNPLENNLLGEEFDFDSVMLYDSLSFSKDGTSMTMVPKEPGVSIVPLDDKPGLSDQDAVKINKLYECFGNKRPPPPKVPDFECNFEDGDTCGLYNDENNDGVNWGGYRGNIGGRTSTYMALYERDSSSSNVARLYTPVFKTYGRENTCFDFDLYFNGAGAAYLDVYAHRSGETTHVVNINTREDKWRAFKISLPHGADVQFSFDGQTSKVDGSGVIAVDNLHFSVDC